MATDLVVSGFFFFFQGFVHGIIHTLKIFVVTEFGYLCVILLSIEAQMVFLNSNKS